MLFGLQTFIRGKMLEVKKDKFTDYVLSWKLTGLYPSKIKPLYTAYNGLYAFFSFLMVQIHEISIMTMLRLLSLLMLTDTRQNNLLALE